MSIFQKKQNGATLLEMMISLFVMGVGMMGVLGMQTQSMRFNHQAYSYSQAVFLAQDVLESIRANHVAAASYQLGLDQNIIVTVDCGLPKSNCSESQLKNWDLANWRDKIAKRLPGGKGAIDVVDSSYTITIEFDLVRSENDELGQTAETKKQIYTLVAGL
jgi:type IV pilus assembly protein PilV